MDEGVVWGINPGASVAPWNKGGRRRQPASVAAASVVAGGAGRAVQDAGEEGGLGRRGWMGTGWGYFRGRWAARRAVRASRRASRAEPRALFAVFFHHQAEPGLGSIFASFSEPSHEPARLGSIPPLDASTPPRLLHSNRKSPLGPTAQLGFRRPRPPSPAGRPTAPPSLSFPVSLRTRRFIPSLLAGWPGSAGWL
jgi:hypothetical protein